MVKQRIGYQLKRASHALRVRMDHVLREAHLTTPQYAALSVIEEAPGLSGNRLARRCFVTPQTMNLILVYLENAGLITRSPHPEYKRTLRAYLTPAGHQLLLENHPRILAIEEVMTASLTEEQRSELLHLLDICASALETTSTEAPDML